MALTRTKYFVIRYFLIKLTALRWKKREKDKENSRVEDILKNNSSHLKKRV
jgi:hypothetical protein